MSSPATGTQSRDGVTEEILSIGAGWQQAEAELARSGLRVPLCHTLAWAKFGTLSRGRGDRLLAVRDSAGRILGSVAIAMSGSRVLPGHRYLRVERLGAELPDSALASLVGALTRLAQDDARVLRLSVRVFSRSHRDRVGETLARYGFQPSPQPESYRHTLTLDLLRDPSEIFAGLHKTARKNLRHAQQSGLFVRTLTDPRYAERIGALEDESMARTGGIRRKIDWRSIVELSRLHPKLSRISGLFLSERDDRPEALVAFGWGSMQGDHASYTAAGTTRLPDRKASLSYPLLWDLVLWAKREGATWFDMGGVTAGSPADPLKGISSFKRYFSRNLEEVSEEWTLEPHPKRTRLASLVSQGFHAFAALWGRFNRDQQAATR